MKLFLRSMLVLVIAGTYACSFSYSSDSSSDSSKHSSDSSTSSSGSSSPDHDHDDDDHDHDHDKDEKKSSSSSSTFDQDVEQYTAAFLDAGGSENASFLSGLGDVARQHGVSDWESQPQTWEAIGRGLARSHATSAERTAYQAAWTGGDPTKQSAMAKGIATTQ
jgi:G3E family GTPase